MTIKKGDLEKALLNIINTKLKLEAIEKAAKKQSFNPEEVDSYNATLNELRNFQHELDNVLEGAKESIISGFSKKVISLLDKIERFDADEAQKYYITEAYINLAYVVDRSKQIKQLYIKRKVPSNVNKRYREAVLCYLNGRFDACCIVCRSIMESVLKKICALRSKDSREYDEYSLSELLGICYKFKILKKSDLKLVKNIKTRGNISIHTEKLASEQDAARSIKETQYFLKNVF